MLYSMSTAETPLSASEDRDVLLALREQTELSCDLLGSSHIPAVQEMLLLQRI